MERGRARRLTLFLTFIGGILLLAFGSLHFPITARAGNARHRPAIVPAGRPSARSPVLGMCAHPNWIISPILTPGVSQDLQGVAATSPSDAWAVGFYDPSSGGGTPLVEHFNGQAWSLSSVPLGSFTGGFLYGITALASNNVWAVGSGSGTGGTLVEQWDGATWNLITSPNHGTDPSELRSVAAVAPDDLWAVGTYSFNNNSDNAQLIEHWNGTSWTIVTGPDSGLTEVILTGVAASSATNVWMVGQGLMGGTDNRSVVEHWNGSTWTVTVFDPVSGQVPELASIAATASGAWVVGSLFDPTQNSNVPLVEFWDGASWMIIPSAPAGSIGSGFTALAIGPYGDVWAVGFTFLSTGVAATHGLIERQSVGGFAIVPDGTGVPQYGILKAVTMVSPGFGFAVGDTGTTNANRYALAERYFGRFPAVSSRVPRTTAGPSFACHV